MFLISIFFTSKCKFIESKNCSRTCFCVDYECNVNPVFIYFSLSVLRNRKHLYWNSNWTLSPQLTMMITETSSVTLAPFEDTLSRMLFGWQQQFSFEKKSETKPSSNGTGSSASKPVAEASDPVKKKHNKKTE